MTDEEIMQSAENVRITELQLADRREQREHERWLVRMQQREKRRARWHETVHGVFHPDSEIKGTAYVAILLILIIVVIPILGALLR